jgi:hypothetical protein
MANYQVKEKFKMHSLKVFASKVKQKLNTLNYGNFICF